MSKRNTIIIAVLINASILAVLFIFAIKSKEEVINESKVAVSELVESTSVDAETLFAGEKVIEPEKEIQPLADTFKTDVAAESKMEIPMQPQMSEEEKIIHALPKVAVEEKEIKEEKIDPVKDEPLRYVVKKGDNLDKIAKLHNVKISEIIKLNHLPNTFLKINQKIKIPTSKISVKKTEEAKSIKEEFYIVKTGDNPYTIAMKHNMKLTQLLKINGLDDKKAKKLKPGDKLRIR